MKKLIAFILVIAVAAGCTSVLADTAKELTFQGVPWYSTPDETVKLLRDNGFIEAKAKISPLNGDKSVDSLKPSHIGTYRKDNRIPYCYTFKDDNTLTSKLLEQFVWGDKLAKTIAKQKIKGINLMYTAEAGNPRLVEVCIWFDDEGYEKNAVYAALETAFGKPNASRKDREYVWLGNNNTIAILYKNDVVFATLDGLSMADDMDLDVPAAETADTGF